MNRISIKYDVFLNLTFSSGALATRVLLRSLLGPWHDYINSPQHCCWYFIYKVTKGTFTSPNQSWHKNFNHVIFAKIGATEPRTSIFATLFVVHNWHIVL